MARTKAHEKRASRVMNTPAEVNIRSIVDEIALQLAEAGDDEDDLSEKICDMTMEHITRLSNCAAHAAL